ncbi:MIF4G domain-containing protein [Theileria equi strain WA]|uniref:MIF4G domain-containing protein n=1 Tax=Theileria equi strain WA TaxID=1537102 RepID=L0B0R2_THEEQ|nr:MIF4G domain-containing protein [Theileria equi strain WA]AFZ81103.1 MIF4G domain-containing protein [Theileria equi strain WA]|eukprot:XP_004830769.1 MIF4G domain-containing protein [Theileria equi strain WA]
MAASKNISHDDAGIPTKSTPSSVFNPDAPEFNPSQIKSSGKLNADAPEFVPGQLPTLFDANLSMLRVPEIVNAGSYKNGHVPNYGRNISQRHQEQQYLHPQMWMHGQQYGQMPMQMGVPYQQHMYSGNASYDYMSYNYSRPQGYHIQRNVYSKPHAEYTINNPPQVQIPYNAVVTGNVPKSGGKHLQSKPEETQPKPMPEVEAAAQQTKKPVETPAITTTPEHVDTTTPVETAPSKPLTWAERTKLSTTRQLVPKKPAAPQIPTEQVSYAKVIKRAAEVTNEPAKQAHQENVKVSSESKPADAETKIAEVLSKTPQVELDKITKSDSNLHTENAKTASESVSESVAEKLDDLKISVSDTTAETDDTDPYVYNITKMLSIYTYLNDGGLEKLRESKDYPILLFSHSNIRDSSSKTSGNRNFNDYSANNSKKGDNWRHSKPFNDQSKGFGNNFRFSHREFSREHSDQQLPAASESSWIIKQAKQKLDKECQLKRKIMGLLNRLTFEKFDIIYDQIIACGIDTPEHALMLVKFVFGKAVTQHHFIPMYVELCTKLAVDLYDIDYKDPDAEGHSEAPARSTEPKTDSKPMDNKTSRNSDFMRILLNCSQESFENNLKPLTIPEDLEGDDIFEFEQKYKHKMRGNMIFVGELFKQKLLAAKLLITCLDQVFSKREECIALYNDINMGNNHLEAMCTLLQTVGRSFDTTRWKHLPEFEKRIQLLAELGKNEDICFRIRCLIKNVLDCRQERWDKQPVHKLEGPCKLQELRSKVNMETSKVQEDLWRKNRKQKNFGEQKSANFPPVESNVQRAVESISHDALKKHVKSILTELILSHDTSESFLRVTELNLPGSRDEELFNLMIMDTIELCAKVTATKERALLTKWLYLLAETRSSQHCLISCLKEFVLNEESENSYAMLMEDYPVLPQLITELLDHMEEGCSGNADFEEIQKYIKA